VLQAVVLIVIILAVTLVFVWFIDKISFGHEGVVLGGIGGIVVLVLIVLLIAGGI
jgi:hypothetical protein